MHFDLVVVMPVYNEHECIRNVLLSWEKELNNLGIQFMILALNDGSRDSTENVLVEFDGNPHFKIINKENSGHGPTVLQGYTFAVQNADWVFQCDSDDEMKPDSFSKLWGNRHEYSALFGIRRNRVQSLGRKIITIFSRCAVNILFGQGVKDVNTPYRLIRSDILHVIITQIPEDTFAPNVIISGSIARAGLKIFQIPVPHQNRKTGTVSITNIKLWKAAFLALLQTLHCRPVISD